ncbi:MAG: chemotaxis protein CheA [Gammaproteobacteria bacterium]|nr:MAG: chemotaxis protein CheA [Gammaproteobacteria bacterium]
MAVDTSDEIVQDFLVEASEILELLNEQLVDLETSPDDAELLNAVFRGFHTIKGGAGFLGLDNLVEVSHVAEDVFSLLRQGERSVDAALMDVMLQVLDILNRMFEELREGTEPGPADPELVSKLRVLAEGGELEENPAEQPGRSGPEQSPAGEDETGATPAGSGTGEITQDEFEELLDAVAAGPEPETATGGHGGGAGGEAGSSDEITEEEFEELLDQIHGKGGFRPEALPAVEGSPAGEGSVAGAADGGKGSDEITEEEFEALLDQIHGKGGFRPGAVVVEESRLVEQQPAGMERREAAAAPAVKSPAGSSRPAKQKTPRPSQPSGETTVRVETQILDRIMNMVGELVLVRNRLKTIDETLNDEDVSKTVANLDLVTSDLQAAAMKTRMQPIKKVFGRFPRVVRDLARQLNKEIRLEMSGEETDLDKNLVEALADPLVHLVRNAVDHGIESPDEREAAGKPRQGTVRLSAETEGDHILLVIADDGRGMDPDALRRKAVEKGIMDEETAGRLSDLEAYNLIFSAGFSTREEISDVSGRGVGMDVVKTRITQLNGMVEVDSVLGQGTTISIKLPLTLAIMPTLMVVLGQQIFALPLVNVNEIIEFELPQLNVIDGQQVMLVRGKPLPLFYLSNWLVRGVTDTIRERGQVVVVSIGTRQVGLLVDQLIGQEEVVIKPLGALLQGTKGLSGATITGDGRIALILDLPSLIQAYAGRH